MMESLPITLFLSYNNSTIIYLNMVHLRIHGIYGGPEDESDQEKVLPNNNIVVPASVRTSLQQ